MDARTTRGVLFASLAAACFGLTAPILGLFDGLLPPQTVSAALAFGAILSAPISRAFGRNGPSFDLVFLPRLMLTALLGSVFAPMLLAYGLSRANGIAACLLLNLEAVFASCLAVFLYREQMGWRFAVGITLITIGAITLTRGGADTEELLGLSAVAASTALWSLDSALSRPLARFDSSGVILRKGIMSAAYALPFAISSGGVDPAQWRPMLLVAVCGLLACGATERFYLIALRLLGVARTGSIFSISPFFSAAVAFLGGEPLSGWWAVSGVLMGLGVWLHAIEAGIIEAMPEASAPEPSPMRITATPAPPRPLASGPIAAEGWRHELP